MSFLAKLFINGRVINVLDTNIRFYQQVNPDNFKPAALPMGGVFNLTIEADGSTDLLGLALSPDTMCEGYIRFYKRDGMTRMQDYEFFDTHIVSYRRNFEGYYGKVTTDHYVLSPGILRIGDMVLEKWWKVSDLAVKDAPAPPPTAAEDKVPQMIETYYEDGQGNRLKNKDLKIGDEVSLVLKTLDGVGKTVSIDLDDNNRDFEYKGKVLNGDLLEGITIIANTQKFRLKVVAPQK